MSLGRAIGARAVRATAARTTVRVAAVGLLAAGLAHAVGGCGVWQQRPSARFARPYTPAPQGQPQFAPETDQAETNGVALNGLPAGVQGAFRSEHPDAAVTAVQQVPTGTGAMLFRVAYLEDGTPGSATYHSGGREMTPPGTGTIIRRDDSGRPRAQYAPGTQPTAAEQPVMAPAAAN